MKMRRCEDEKKFYRPPLLEEPCAQTLWGIKDVTAMTRIFLDSDHYIVIGDCCVRLQAKPKHVHRPKYRQPTREQIAAFNAVIAQYMQETTRRDIGVFLRAIQDADKQCCVLLRCHLSNAGLIFLDPLGTRS